MDSITPQNYQSTWVWQRSSACGIRTSSGNTAASKHEKTRAPGFAVHSDLKKAPRQRSVDSSVLKLFTLINNAFEKHI